MEFDGIYYPVVHGGSEKRSGDGVSIFPRLIPYEKWGAVWSYLDFLLGKTPVNMGYTLEIAI